MKRTHIRRMIASLLVLCCLSVTTVYATVTQDDINDAKEQVDNLQQQVDEAEKELDKHNDKKDELEGDLKDLNTNLQTLANELSDLEEQITDKQDEIEVTTAELDEAEKRSAKQYEDMKVRIQYMYENGNTSMLTMFLEAESMSDFLNQTEYIASINTYDREKLDEFQQLQAEIAEKKALLEEEEKELLALKDDMVQKRAEVNSLIAATEKNISQTKTEIAQAEAEMEDLEEQLKYWEDYERELEAQKLQQDLELWEEIQGMGGSWSGGSYTPAEGEAYLLAAIIQCESEGEPYEGKLAVGSVVMNRVAHPKFPNTITEVIYQKKQFSPVASGRLAYRLQAGVNEECKRAAAEVLNGNITNNCLFFRTVIPGINGTIIGNHIFY
ncbi:MAG: cell wall hydrolase [Roseburia sp.]|nr:cell wall hydrolase [Roseburia sp.]